MGSKVCKKDGWIGRTEVFILTEASWKSLHYLRVKGLFKVTFSVTVFSTLLVSLLSQHC